ncbi:MAG TPA: L,D-transpeptidase family protein [Micropepsaceae bacterium]|jgi:L,D-peptidoglycan transpeptidase YkuD (ErfK/YbiS/YcfS/YnhG family)|nr:L,D-transpeptidase family protein [Micropepsaceae bacterium]
MDIVVRREGEITVADWGAGPRRCAVGRAGIAEKLREGDGVTPAGVWPLRNVLYRADRVARPRSVLPTTQIEPEQAWCDVPDDPHYNRLVRLPHASLDERLWREDSLYDLIVVVGFNDAPVVPGKGSAIFVHLARPDYGATQGCVALSLDDLTEALAQLRLEDRLAVRK